MLLIQASNIHIGGGATLLRPLLQASFEQKRKVWVDSRFGLPTALAPGVTVSQVRPTIAARLQADAQVARQAAAGDVLLCLGNLPPIRRTACRTVVYLQNRYLVGPPALEGVPLRERVRLTIERQWLRKLVTHAHLFLVQTPSMQHAVCKHLNLEQDRVRVAPYLPGDASWPRSLAARMPVRDDDDRPFLYVASGERHKNHRTLVQAWSRLAAEGIFPRLQLTLDQARFPLLSQWIEEQVRHHGLLVEVNAATREDVPELYRKARALVYPSGFESFGLPLIEARQAGLPVLAPELDYVRDVLDPDESFDANSARSIARAVKRFLGVDEPGLPTMGAERFMQMLWAECRR